MLFFLLLIFFSTPILNIRTGMYSSADTGQMFALFNIAPGYVAKNQVLSDTVVDFQPWLLFNRDSLRVGQVPLWNPYNGNGIPHLANYSSAVLSPYTLPFYILPFRVALLLSAFMKLFGIGFFTFLYLKYIGLRQIPALVGATAFMFSGYNIIWLGYSLPSPIVCLPACLYFSEHLFSQMAASSATPQHEPLRSRGTRWWALVGFTLSLTVGLLGGHPETFFTCFLLVTFYIAFRLIDLWRMQRFQLVALRGIIMAGSKLALAGAFAAILASAQLLPFFEYVQNSDHVHNKNASRALVDTTKWPIALYPDLFGNPSKPHSLAGLAALNMGYHNENGMYIGSFVCFLAVIALWVALFQTPPLRRYLLFFGGVAVVWVVYATNFLDLKPLFNVIPGISMIWVSRTHPIWLFALSCCVALLINYLFVRIRPVRYIRIILPLAGLVFLAIGANGIMQLANKSYPAALSKISLGQVEGFAQVVLMHILLVTISFGAGLFAITALWGSRRRLTRTLWGSLLLVVIFFQSGFLFRNYNPTTEDRYFYPDSPDIRTLQSITRQNLAVIGQSLWADMNMAYKFPILSSYDVVGIRHYTRLLEAKYKYWHGPQFLTTFDEAGLRLFGVDALLVDNAEQFKDVLDSEDFELVPATGLGKYSIYKYTNSVPLYHIVYKARVTSSEEQAFNIVQRSKFDPATEVILLQPDNSVPLKAVDATVNSESAATVEVLSEEPLRINLKVTQEQPGYLVITKVHYPGWKVKVNDNPQPLYQANYAFNAVALHAGENNVEYYYDPESFKYGALISISGVILGAALCVFFALRYRSRPMPQPNEHSSD